LTWTNPAIPQHGAPNVGDGVAIPGDAVTMSIAELLASDTAPSIDR